MARPRKTSRPASFPADRRDFEELMALADHRMYFHKREYHANRTRALVGAAAGGGAAVAG